MKNPTAIDIVDRIVNSQMDVLRAADHLVNEYTRHDGGHGTGVGMRAAEDRLINMVKIWPDTSQGRTEFR